MATKLVKNYLMAIVAMVMVAGFSAFKVVERVNSTEQDGWYNILFDDTDPEDPDFQEIVDYEGEDEPTGNDCNLTKLFEPCQVELDLTNFISSIPITEMTVSQAVDSGAQIIRYAHRVD